MCDFFCNDRYTFISRMNIVLYPLNISKLEKYANCLYCWSVGCTEETANSSIHGSIISMSGVSPCSQCSFSFDRLHVLTKWHNRKYAYTHYIVFIIGTCIWLKNYIFASINLDHLAEVFFKINMLIIFLFYFFCPRLLTSHQQYLQDLGIFAVISRSFFMFLV